MTRPKAKTGPKRRPSIADEEAALWAARDRDASARAALVERFYALAVSMADRVKVHLDECDKRGAAHMALVNAVDRFEPSRGLKFATFLFARVRGEVMDAARGNDFLTRRGRDRQHGVEASIRRLAAQFGRPPTDDDLIADGLTADDLHAHRFSRLGQTGTMERGEDWQPGICDPPAPAVPSAMVCTLKFHWALAGLNIEDAIVLYLWLVKGVKNRTIADLLQCSESRVSQRAKRALALLREKGDRIKETLAG